MFITTNRLIAGLFTVLLLGAAFFSLERVLFADASFILFRIINHGSLQIQEHRYGSFFTQSIPLLSSYLHIPLPAIAVLYSISFNLFYLVVILLLLYRFKEQYLAVLMSFYFLLFVSDTFFWMNNEVHQGMAWMFLFFAVTKMSGRKNVHRMVLFPVFSLLALLTLFTHPLLLFPTSYLWLLFCTGKEWPFSKRRTLLLSFMLLLLAASKLYLSLGASSHYDAEKLQNIRQFSWEGSRKSLSSPFVKEWLRHTIWNYWLVPVLFVTGLIAAWQKKAWYSIALTTGYAVVYFMAVSLTFHDFTPFYTESELMPTTVFLTAPFVYFVLPALRPKPQLMLLAAIFLIRLSYIGFASEKWIDRKEWIMHTLKSMRSQHITKGMIYENDENKKRLFLTWATPAESIIASALKGDNPQLTFVVENKERLANRQPPDNATMIASFELLHQSLLNKTYFRLDTTTRYQLLNVPWQLSQ